MSVTDLCASRTEGAGGAWEGPGGPVTGRDWSTGCSAEGGSLEVHRNTLHDVKSCCTNTSQSLLHFHSLGRALGKKKKLWFLTLLHHLL